jgi:hypothetical protein
MILKNNDNKKDLVKYFSHFLTLDAPVLLCRKHEQRLDLLRLVLQLLSHCKCKRTGRKRPLGLSDAVERLESRHGRLRGGEDALDLGADLEAVCSRAHGCV